MKLLFWVLLACLIVFWLARGTKKQAAQSPTDNASAEKAEKMLKCGYCGLHVPASEAHLHSSGAAFCSEEHKRLTFP